MKYITTTVLLMGIVLALSVGCSGQETPKQPNVSEETVPKTETVATETEVPESESIIEEIPEIKDGVKVSFSIENNSIQGKDGGDIFVTSYKNIMVSMEGNLEAEKKINDFFAGKKQEYLQVVEENKKDAETFFEESGGEGNISYSLDYSYAVQRNQGNILSVSESGYIYQGGAHGSYWTSGYSFDIRTGELLALSDLAENGDSFYELCVNDMIEQSRAMPAEMFFYAPDSEDFLKSIQSIANGENWFFNREGITFVANIYEIAPYAAGAIEFGIPYEKLQGLKSDYLYEGPYEKITSTGSCVIRDLNGDGNAEEILYDINYLNNNEMKPQLTISGKDFTNVFEQENVIFDNPVYQYIVLDLDMEDSYLELAFMDYGPSDDPVTYFFRYDGQNLLYMGQIWDLLNESACRFEGDGTVTDTERMSLLETAYIMKMYRINEDGKVDEVIAQWYEINPGESEKTEHNVIKEISLFQEKDLNSGKTVLKPEDGPVVFIRTDNRNWVEVKNKKGELSYLYLTDFCMVGTEGQEDVSGYFDQLLMAD